MIIQPLTQHVLGPYLKTPSSDFHEILATSGGHKWDAPHQILGNSDEEILREGVGKLKL